jgi:hypothetical protein
MYENSSRCSLKDKWELFRKHLQSHPENIGLLWTMYRVRQEKVIYFQIRLFKITVFWDVKGSTR